MEKINWWPKIVIAIIIPLSACSQIERRGKEIRLQLSGEQVVLKLDELHTDLNISLTNKTGRSFLLYGFKEMEESDSDEKYYTEGNDMAVGNALFIIDNKNKRVSFEIRDSLEVKHYTPFPYDSLKKSFERVSQRIEDKKIVIHHNDTLSYTIPIDFKQGWLEKGTYTAYLVYYCGKNITNLVDAATIKSDEKKNGAILFQGYVKSNPIKLIVQ